MVAMIDPGTAAAQQNAVATPLKCPRCDSANTKFCYYNNYSLSQPRHFCKSCKRYWTRGGTLRNVPVGGGSRKNKRAKKHHRSAATSEAAVPSLPPPPIIHVTPTDFSSLLYGLPAINTSTASLPKFDLDAQLAAGYDGKYFQPCLGANLQDLQKLTAPPKIFLGDYSLLTSQVPSSSSAAACAGTAVGYQPLISFDEFPIETHENNTSHKSIHCQFIKDDNPAESINSFADSGPGAAVADSSYIYWNQAVSGGWPESGSFMAPLF